MSSDYLYASPSLLHGLGRIFDPWGTPEPYNWSRTPAHADALGMALNWDEVGRDLQSAMSLLGAPSGKQLELFGEQEG